MKSICAIGTIAITFSSALSANEIELKDSTTVSSETLSVSELLSHVEDTVGLVVGGNEEISQLAYHELQESLRIVYTLNYLHRNEASTILEVLDKCYENLVDAIDKDPSKTNILKQSLSLFASGRNYDHETLAVQSLHDWTDITPSNELKSTLEATDADLVYIQNDVLWNIEKCQSRLVFNNSIPLLYRTSPPLDSTPKILIIKHKSDDSPEYKFEGGYKWKLGGKDHGKSSSYFEGEIKDKDGNYAKGRISKETDDDGYECDVKAGKEKKK